MLRMQSMRQAHCVVKYPRSPQPANRVVSSRRYTNNWINDSAMVDQELVEWARARTKAMEVDLTQIDKDLMKTDTTLAQPWRMVSVPSQRLEMLRYTEYPCAGSSTMLWGIGPERPVANCNPYDVNPAAIDSDRKSSRPGKGPFANVVRGAYGNRNVKYLWAIDHRGMHIAREMIPCKLSSRGIITHSILVDRGIIAGEVFFDANDTGKVLINFGSARLPIEDFWQAEKSAEFMLALGYHEVVAVVPNRDLRAVKYGMADRYGQNVQNIVFRQAVEEQPL